MASRFHNITKDEWEELLVTKWGFSRTTDAKTSQLVYAKDRVVNGKTITCVIFSGINPDGNSRAIGSDAISITFQYKYDGETYGVGKTRKCLRVKNWAKNIEKALREMLAELPFCPKCGHPMSWRDKGEFYGCSTFFKTQCPGK